MTKAKLNSCNWSHGTSLNLASSKLDNLLCSSFFVVHHAPAAAASSLALLFNTQVGFVLK